MKEKVGAVLFVLGWLSADSEWLIVPIVLVASGIGLMWGLIEW